MNFENNSTKKKNIVKMNKTQKSFHASNSFDVSMNILEEVDILSSEKPKNKEEVRN
jgi:hypothetical protein